jgi:hypothetical protein
VAAFQRSAFQNNAYQGDGVPVPAVVSTPGVTGGGGRGKWYRDETELWEYIAALKSQFQEEAEERKEVVARKLEPKRSDAKVRTYEVEIPSIPIDALYADLDDLLSSTAALETRWADAQRIEREFRALKEEEAVVKLFLRFMDEEDEDE